MSLFLTTVSVELHKVWSESLKLTGYLPAVFSPAPGTYLKTILHSDN